MDLSCNYIRGNIPTSFANLTKLSILYLYENEFTGGDVEIVLANLTGLTYIDLNSNHFKSSFPSFLLKISSLVAIALDENLFEGTLDFGNTSSSSKLEVLNVRDNKFDGLVPESIWKLHNLNTLDLSHNNFKGRVPSSISKLNLISIDLSYNKFEGQVPPHLWKVQWRPSKDESGSLKLSHNSFNSFGKPVEVIDGALVELDLGSNLFQETFPQWICKFRNLTKLDLSNNRFSGSIPQCLKNFTNLRELTLRNNSLSGLLPDLNASELRSLDVSRNNLLGKLPRSLIISVEMEFLNVKGNKIKDTFPFWLGSLQVLNVLMLGSNAFYGPVYNPSTYLGFTNLQIIDISNNNFVGSLPQDYFYNWTIMSLVWSGYESLHIPEFGYMGDESINMVYKGVDMDFVRILKGFKAIDFSGNRFSGHIPTSIGLLSELNLLNLSGNTFAGNIPPSLTNITKLEILDLSRNNLSGEIPRGLVNLSFLSYINFSNNHLQGLVPQSPQFGSQNCSSFMNNPGLYGFEENCAKNRVPVLHQPDESLTSDPDEPVLNWKVAAIVFGPGVFCGLVIGHIFTSYKHEWFNYSWLILSFKGFVKFVLR
ncbi:PREDICTED: receptor like protein 30-like [Camelina sativa]|uniref:Receptor like protein 30-like n=1 Tax=Camelina sativa TaxID=90675 RepID=A0ABM0W735_CAMSA|nr:PREDICTED: receptor like protein 30-like [Camelina sativa]